MKSLLQIIDSVSEWSGKVFSLLAIVVVFIITYEVIARYAFGSPTKWAHESMTILSGVIYIIGGAYTLYVGGHVNVDVLYGRLSRRGRAILDLVTFPFLLAFVSVILWSGGIRGWESVMRWETRFSHWSPPLWPIRLMVPLGGLLILVQGLAKFIRDLSVAIARVPS